MIENAGTSEPVRLPPGYVETIKSKTKLGGGYFGKVRLGKDIVLKKNFAMKMVDSRVIEESLTNRLGSIKSSFQTEIRVSMDSYVPIVFKHCCTMYLQSRALPGFVPIETSKHSSSLWVLHGRK